MSTQSLLSILSKGQATRARSQANRHGLSPTFSFMPRSSSTSLHKHETAKADSPQRSQQLIKVIHLLNVKVKQSYYFSFCRIEQIYKHYKKNSKMETVNTIETQTKQQKDTLSEVLEVDHKSFAQPSDSISQGIIKLIDFENTLSSKIQMRCQEALVKKCFSILHRRSSTVSGSLKIDKVCKVKTNNFKAELIAVLKAIQKQKIREQIALQSIACILTKKIDFAFQALKKWQPSQFNIQQQNFINSYNALQNIIQESQSEFTSQELSFTSELSYPNEVPFNSPQEKHLQAVIPKNIKLQQKKVMMAKAINLPSLKFLKSAVKMPVMEATLQGYGCISQAIDKAMRRCLPLKSEVLVTCMSDLCDNCNLFNSFPQLLQGTEACSPTVTYQQCNFLQKNSCQLFPTDDCTTQRYLHYKSVHPDRKSSIYKHNSMGNIMPKQIIPDDHFSPLLKMEQLMHNINDYKSAKQKKTLNVNLPKNIYQATIPISTFSKTPSKERINQQAIFRSDNKENFLERLVTQRAKQINEKGGLDCNSAGKPKSTVLIRDRRAKMQKKEIFTARKMKIEIENIINRRNKQIASKNEVRPLK